MQYTLEEHFKNLGDKYEQVNEVYCLWTLLKKDISEKLGSVYRVFPYFSRHDSSHSRTIITNIELFLGEERIHALSATDTFMLLICAYTHDYGMALELEEILEILSDSGNEFKIHLKNHISNDAAKRLIKYYNKEASDGDLKEFYYSILIMLQDYNRPNHWRGVEKIKRDYDNIFLGRIKARFIKAIINICEIHGKDVESISTLSRNSNGMFSDIFHPRFIAAMIRLGDLLDLDNNRFSKEFQNAIQKNENNIPDLSKIHYMKHEAITHFFVCPTHIDIEASCDGIDSLFVARELYDWLHWLENDCSYLKKEWDMIAQRDFGAAPRIRNKKIWVNGLEYQHFVYNLRMELPSDKIFNLLAGSNVYENKYVAFREIIQNAIDATLLQAWEDFYSSLTSDYSREDCSKELAKWCLSPKFGNEYRIQVNVIENNIDNAVFVEVIDNGIGIDDEDLQYMCRIGENNICNPQRHKLIEQMPDWFIPSGVFGIGLQSAFQLTDEVEFFTKKANRTPRHIRFSSYSSNQGKIEVSKCPNSYFEQFNKLTTQGTLVRLKINSGIFNSDKDFDFFDLDFESCEINNHVIYVEIIDQLKKYFMSNTINYFPIYFSDYKFESKLDLGSYSNNKIKVEMDKEFYMMLNSTSKIRWTRRKRSIILYYWNEKKNIFVKIEIPKCKLIDDQRKHFSFIFLDNAFSIKYKNNVINDFQQLFEPYADDIYSKTYDLNNNVIRCMINIFDKTPENYLNIDRSVLKCGEIKYSDIISYEEEMFSLFCEEIMKNDLFNNDSDKKRSDPQHIKKDDYLPILSALFYRFAFENPLHSFLNKYNNDISGYKIALTDEWELNTIPLQSLLGNGCSFFVYDIVDEDYISIFEEIEELTEEQRKNTIYISDLYEHFPHHFFIPVKMRIQKYKSEIWIVYECKIRRRNCISSIDVDDSCWKLDCAYLGGKNAFCLNKTVLKPISKYKNLFVNKIPKTFHKSPVFINVLDENISTYILSPLDQDLSHQLFECKKCKSVEELDLNIKNISNKMVGNIHFNKCLNYVIKNTCNHETHEVSEEILINEYKQLIEDIGNALFQIKI